MAYCLNPACSNPTAPQNSCASTCFSCGFQLLLQDRFRALKPIGQGGFGRTFLAVDEQHAEKLRCVIKQSMPDQLQHREQATEMFHQEALRLAALGQHPQIPQLIAHCQQEHYQYLVQEFIDGQTLEQLLAERGQFTAQAIEQLLQRLLPVLVFIHAHGVIHRDIKPDNIIRQADGQIVLVDFGAAKHATGTALLRTGTTIGSAEFIAPEQARGKATYASDLYSLGVTCVYLLTQVSPFHLIDGDNQWVWHDWLNGKLSPELRYCLNQMIALAPNQRFQSAIEVQAFLAKPELPETAATKKTSVVMPSSVAVPSSRTHWLHKPLSISAIAIWTVGIIAAAMTFAWFAAKAYQAAAKPNLRPTPRYAPEVHHMGESHAKGTISYLLLQQKLYFYQTKQFSTDLHDLHDQEYIGGSNGGKSVREETDDYSFKVVQRLKTSNGSPAVQHLAMPKTRGLTSFIGIVWAGRTYGGAITVDAIICASSEPTVQTPAEPQFAQTPPERLFPKTDAYVEEAICPPGYAQIGHY